MVRRRRLSSGAWIVVLALGLIGFILGLTGLVLMAVWGEWRIGTIMGAVAAIFGGAGCTIAGIAGIRSRRGSAEYSS